MTSWKGRRTFSPTEFLKADEPKSFRSTGTIAVSWSR